MISDDLLKRTLENIISSTTAHNYFFNNLNSPVWLQPLKENNYFTSPPPAIRKDGFIQFPAWAESGYLVRVAEKAPDEVLEIIKKLPETDNERVMDDVVNALLKIETAKVVRQTERVKQYVNSSQYLLLDRSASDFVCKLADNGYSGPALGLAQEMLQIMPDPDKEEKLKSDYVMIRPVTKYRDYEYKSIVDKVTPSLASSAPLATIDMYAELLQRAIDYELTFFKEDGEEVTLEEKKDDFSYVWRPDISEGNEHNHDPEDILTTALRDSIVVLMRSKDIQDIEKLSKLKELAVNKYSIFKRVVEFGLRDYKGKQAFKPFYDALVSDDRLKKILEGEKTGVGKITSGSVIERPTNVLKSLSDTGLLNKLKTYKSDSDWSFERDSISKELANLITQDPKRFIPLVKDIAAINSEYLSDAIHAFEVIADDLDDQDIIQLTTKLTEVFSNERPSGQEAYDYFDWAQSGAVRLVEKLVSQKEDKSERASLACLGVLTSLLLHLCRSKKPTAEDDKRSDPADLSLNSTRGKAVHALVYLLSWMHRSKAEIFLYKPIFDELSWHLDIENDPSPAVRAVYGWRFEFFYSLDREWVLENIKNIFTSDELGEAAFDAFSRFSRVHQDEVDILKAIFLKQIPRLATLPSKEEDSRHDALESFVQRLALHYWHHALDLSTGSMLDAVIKTADIKYLRELVNFIGFRLYKNNGDEPTESELQKLMDLWEAVAKQAELDSTKVSVLEEFGAWFASGKFNPAWSFENLTQAATKAGDIHLDFAALEQMTLLASEYPEESLKALSAMIDGATASWSVPSWRESATKIIQLAYEFGGDDIKRNAISLTNRLVAMGYLDYRNTLKNADKST